MSERLQTIYERARLNAPDGYFLQGIYNLNNLDEAAIVEACRLNSKKYCVIELGVGNVAVYEVNEYDWLAKFLGTNFLR